MRRKTAELTALSHACSRSDRGQGRTPRRVLCRRRMLCAALCVLWMAFLLISLSLPLFSASPTVTTTLQDQTVQRGSKKTFDVWARNGQGKKIPATVKFNGVRLDPTWDDNEKASYTLHFTQAGENTVTVSATSDGGKKKELVYHITYQPAQDGEVIGSATWSVELFTLGCGYLIQPTEVPIYEGETSADQLLRLLSENGYCAYYGGKTSASFYLGYIANGDAASAVFSGYHRSPNAPSPRHLDIVPNIPLLLALHLSKTMDTYLPNDYTENWQGYLGEFVISNGSGWMFSLNNRFPNVGFADTFLSDGDVVRVRFTLGYGADIGGFGAMGTNIPNADAQPTGNYYAVANKDALTSALSRAAASGLLSYRNVKQAYDNALTVAQNVTASQKSVDAVLDALNAAMAHPSDTLPDTTPVTSPRTDPPATDPNPPTPPTPSVSSSAGRVTEPSTTTANRTTTRNPHNADPRPSDDSTEPDTSEPSSDVISDTTPSEPPESEPQSDSRSEEQSSTPDGESTNMTVTAETDGHNDNGDGTDHTGRNTAIIISVAVAVTAGGSSLFALKYIGKKRKH